MREKAIDAFLKNAGFGGAENTPLAGDASFRSYRRLTHKGKTYVLMNAPPGPEDVRPFIAVAEYLERLGLSAPKIIARDIKEGLLILEDFGDDKFTNVLDQTPEMAEELYPAAVDVLVRLHKATPPDTFACYDRTLLFEEIFLFSDWYLPALFGEKNPGWRNNLEDLFSPLLERLVGPEPRLVLRDYHADNLMWLPEREGIRRVGLLDFQDAVRGHPAYDLVSLMQDCRRPFCPDREVEMIDYYLKKSDWQGTRQEFLEAYEILGAQRNMKIIGIFTRLWKRDGKPAYPKIIPHVWSLLDKNLTHPLLAEVKDWIGGVAPKEGRGI